MSEPTSTLRRFRTRDGIELVGDAWGSPEARPVLLAHGGGQTRHAWGTTASALAAAGWYAVALDLRGHGDSGWCDEGNYGVDSFGLDLHDVATTFDTRPAVVGASLGGIAALSAQGSGEADCFSAIVLVDITPNIERSGAEKILGFMGDRLEQGFASLEEAADSIARHLPHRPRPKSLEGLQKNLRKRDDGRFYWHWDPRFITARNRLDGRNEEPFQDLNVTARNLRVPVLLVRGRMSELVSEESAQAFLRDVPHAKYADVSGAGHMVAGDRNDVFTGAVLEFLDGMNDA